MGLLDSLLKAEQKIQSRIDRTFGKGAARTPLELRREIFEEVENGLVKRGGKRFFPFARIVVRLLAADSGKLEILRAAFQEEDALAKDIRQLLRGAGCEPPGNLGIVLDFKEAAGPDAESGGQFELEFIRPRELEAPPARRVPAAEYTVLKGTAEHPVYRLDKERVQIGRLGELLDKEGHVVRRNDLVFLDNGDDVNSTVGRAHATICFNRDKNEFRIVDEMSRYGTRIFRDGRSAEVPAGNPRGVRLHPGDEIYLGHACVRISWESTE